jgi:hypothetical protein
VGKAVSARCMFGLGNGHTIVISLYFGIAFLGGIVGDLEIFSHTLNLVGII